MKSKVKKQAPKRKVRQIEAPKMIPVSQTDKLIELAARPDFNPETLRQLIELKNLEEKRAAKKEFDIHFAEMQAQIPIIRKTKKNFTNYYAPLEEIIRICAPIMADHRFSYSFHQESLSENRVRIFSTISGYGYDKECYVDMNIIEVSTATNDNQDIMSAKSYGKRYALSDNLGLVFEGTDKDGATETKKSTINKNNAEDAEVVRSVKNMNQKLDSVVDHDAMTKEEREMIETVLTDDEKKAWRKEVFEAAKKDETAVKDVRKRYREIYKQRIQKADKSAEEAFDKPLKNIVDDQNNAY